MSRKRANQVGNVPPASAVRRSPDHPNPAAELGSLARELAHAYVRLVESHRRSWSIGPAEADAMARGSKDEAIDGVRDQSPNTLPWWSLAVVMEHDPAAVLAVWEEVTRAARDELHSGHRIGESLEWDGTPWERARFLAIRDAFRTDWQPRGSIEDMLVDMLAQAFESYLRWTALATMRAGTEGRREQVKLGQDTYRLTPRISDIAAIEQAANRADRAQLSFLRTLRTLQDLRRLPAVNIATAGQVNVGAQQVNLSTTEASDGHAHDFPK